MNESIQEKSQLVVSGEWWVIEAVPGKDFALKDEWIQKNGSSRARRAEEWTCFYYDYFPLLFGAVEKYLEIILRLMTVPNTHLEK